MRFDGLIRLVENNLFSDVDDDMFKFKKYVVLLAYINTNLRYSHVLSLKFFDNVSNLSIGEISTKQTYVNDVLLNELGLSISHSVHDEGYSGAVSYRIIIGDSNILYNKVLECGDITRGFNQKLNSLAYDVVKKYEKNQFLESTSMFTDVDSIEYNNISNVLLLQFDLRDITKNISVADSEINVYYTKYIHYKKEGNRLYDVLVSDGYTHDMIKQIVYKISDEFILLHHSYDDYTAYVTVEYPGVLDIIKQVDILQKNKIGGIGEDTGIYIRANKGKDSIKRLNTDLTYLAKRLLDE